MHYLNVKINWKLVEKRIHSFVVHSNESACRKIGRFGMEHVNTSMLTSPHIYNQGKKRQFIRERYPQTGQPINSYPSVDYRKWGRPYNYLKSAAQMSTRINEPGLTNGRYLQPPQFQQEIVSPMLMADTLGNCR